MKLSVDSGDLRKALGLIARAVAPRDTIPILRCARLTAADGRLTILTTNLETYAEAWVDAEIEEPGACCVGAAELQGFAALKGTQGRVTLVMEKAGLAARAGRARITFAVSDPDEFPSKEPEAIELVPLASDLLAQALDWCCAAASTNETLFYLCGVRLEPRDGGVVAFGTNRQTMHRVEIPGLALTQPVTVPKAAQALLSGVLKSADHVRFGASEKLWLIEAGGARIWGLVIDGAYPDLDLAMARFQMADTMFAERDDVSEAARAAELGGSTFEKTRSKQVILRSDLAGASVRGHNSGAAVSRAPAADLEAEIRARGAMCLSSTYLSAALAGMPEGEIAIGMEIGDDDVAEALSIEPREQAPLIRKRAFVMGQRITPAEAWAE